MIDFRRSADRIPQEKVQANRGFLPIRNLNKSDWDLAAGCMEDRSLGNGAFRLQGVLGRAASAAFSPSVRERPTFFLFFFLLIFFFTRLQRFPVITTTVSGCFSDTQLSDTFSASVRERPTFLFCFFVFSFSWLQRFPMITNENGQRLFFWCAAESFSASVRERPTAIFLIHICVVFSKTIRTANTSFSFTQLQIVFC